MTKGKRVELSLQRKVELIHAGVGKSHRQIAKLFGIGKTQVHGILKRKAELLTAYNEVGDTSRKRICYRGDHEDIDDLTWRWVQSFRSRNVPVTGPMIQRQALAYAANKAEKRDFKASNGWLSRFKRRHNIASPTTAGRDRRVSQTSDVMQKVNLLHQEEAVTVKMENPDESWTSTELKLQEESSELSNEAAIIITPQVVEDESDSTRNLTNNPLEDRFSVPPVAGISQSFTHPVWLSEPECQTAKTAPQTAPEYQSLSSPHESTSPHTNTYHSVSPSPESTAAHTDMHQSNSPHPPSAAPQNDVCQPASPVSTAPLTCSRQSTSPLAFASHESIYAQPPLTDTITSFPLPGSSRDIQELHRQVLILQQEKLLAEKDKLVYETEKLKIEKEKLLIEKDILLIQRQRLLA